MLDLIQQQTLTPPQLALLQSQDECNNALLLLRDATVGAFRRFWNGVGAESPETQLAELGTNAVAHFTKHATTVQFLLGLGVPMDAADYTPPREYVIEKGPDGVTPTGRISLVPLPPVEPISAE